MSKLITIHGIVNDDEYRATMRAEAVLSAFSVHIDLPISAEDFPILGEEKQYKVAVQPTRSIRVFSFTTTAKLSPDLVKEGWIN